ncbi:bifunctional hydroxymethylpyrimidine kinase/phosphomethylpyrimidine kinase [Ochrobactrum vermis]|uniref:pyridoxal kinase n=1 Tax=Ochrobactrum vermis TaxID=1827297 RepID=A0ABU8PN12_9HYPH
MYGHVLGAEFVEGLLHGIEERGLVERTTAIVTGFLGSVENGEVVANFVSCAQARNPALIYVCDPVMGDDDLGLFVEEGLTNLFCDRLASLASVITPNQYEIELLARIKARSAEGIDQAMQLLSQRGTGAGVVTGCVLDDTLTGSVETVVWTPERLTRIATPRLPIRPCGTGDLFTALLLSRLCTGEALRRASELATSEILAVLERTQKAGSPEMSIVDFPFNAGHRLELVE